MNTSTSPLAVSSSATVDRWASSSWIVSPGRPADATAVESTPTSTRFVWYTEAEPRSSAAFPLLMQSAAASAVTFRPGLVHDPDDPDRNPDLADT